MAEYRAAATPSKKAADEAAPFPNLAAWLNGEQTAATWLEPQQKMTSDTLALMQSCMKFWQSRLQTDINAVKNLSGCRDYSELFQHQVKFVQDAVTDYFDQGHKLQTGIVHLMDDVASSCRSQAAKIQPPPS